MALDVGSRLGHYTVDALIGEGGMGQVYRATDTKLNRQVALKILPEAFASDPDRLARFQREAQVLASLNHPGIAAIHGIEESDGQQALVLELVEGPTLADRIAKGPIPLDEALPIAKQIAEALEAAHEAGVIHRDLKPANIKVRDDGTVKVLDFGLAKALDPTPEGDPSQSPTLTAAATQMGVIMGTAAYMSPEQARGKPVDKRADIWAFGCVLYEMVTGRTAFRGEDVGETLAAVIQSSPNWDASALPTGSSLDTLLRRCLQKDPKKRLRDIGEARLVLDQDGVGHANLSVGAVSPLRHWTKITAAAVCGAVVGGVVVSRLLPPPSGGEPTVPLRVSASAPGLAQGNDVSQSLAISKDGRALVYQADAALSRLHVRALDTAAVTILANGDGPLGNPFFSPDGEWVGFAKTFEGDSLWRAPVRGGPAMSVTGGEDIGAIRAASWGDDGHIYVGGEGMGLARIPEGGGTVQQLTELLDGETAHTQPHYVPEASVVLFAAEDGLSAEVNVLSLDTGARVPLVAGQAPHFTTGGRLVYLRDGQLYAVGFDAEALALTGTPVVVDVTSGGERIEAFSVSETGTLAFATSRGFGLESELVWVARDGGQVELAVDDRQQFSFPRLSPDGQRLAVNVLEGADGGHVWVYDLERGAGEPLTREGVNLFPAWSSNGDRIAFGSQRDGSDNYDLYWRRSDGTGAVERLLSRPFMQLPMHGFSDGETVSFVEATPAGNWDVWQVSGNGEVKALVSKPGLQGNHSLSPDESYLAYIDSDTGNFENLRVAVEPYQSTGRRVVVSAEQGVNEPLWSPSGRELYYRSVDGSRMMVVSVDAGPPISFGAPDLLFEGDYRVGNLGGLNYDVSNDGQRFLMVRSTSGSDPEESRIHLVINWTEELKRLVPTDD